MKVITLESEAYKRLVRKIEWLYSYAKKQAKENATPQPNPSNVWFSNMEAAAILRVSKRTLQRYRSAGELTYITIHHKIFYTEKNVEKFIRDHFVKGDDNSEIKLEPLG